MEILLKYTIIIYEDVPIKPFITHTNTFCLIKVNINLVERNAHISKYLMHCFSTRFNVTGCAIYFSEWKDMVPIFP